MPFIDENGVERTTNPLAVIREFVDECQFPDDMKRFCFGDLISDAIPLIDTINLDFSQGEEYCWSIEKYERQEFDAEDENEAWMQKIYIALSRRVFALRKFLLFDNYVKVKEHIYPENVTQALHLWLEAHFPLMSAFDRDLPITRELFERKRPRLEHIFHEGELPDIPLALINSNFWEKNKISDKNPLVRLVTKAHPLRCQIRSLAKTIHNYCKVNDNFKNVWISIMAASTLGSYSHARHTLGFREHRLLYTLFFENRERNQQLLFDKMNAVKIVIERGKKKPVHINEKIIMLMLQEFIVYYVELFPSIRSVIAYNYDWSHFRRETIDTADKMRCIIFQNAKQLFFNKENLEHIQQDWPNIDFIDKIFYSVDGMLNKNKASNFALYGPRPDNFFKVALDKCKVFEEDHLLKNRDFNGDTLPTLPHELKHMIRSVIRAHDPLGHFSISSEIPRTVASIDRFANENIIPGRCLGLMPQNVDSLTGANNIYPELKEKVINNLIRQVFERSLEDFVAMKTIFKEIHEHRSVTIIPLPVHIYVKQVVALKKKFNIPFDRPLPDKLGTFLACVTCRSFKGPLSVVRKKMRKNTKKRKMSAEKMKNDRREYEYYIIGNQRVLIDEDTDRLYCKGNKNKNDDKKQTKNLFPNVPENSALSHKQREDAEKKLIKNALKERNEKKCIDTELTRISLVGNAFRFFGKCYILCPSCATPFEYNWTKFGYGQLTCRKCPSKEMLDRDIRCVFCNKTEERTEKTNTYKILETLSTDVGDYSSRQDLQLKKVFLCKKHDVGGKQKFNGNTREELFALVEEIQAQKAKK